MSCHHCRTFRVALQQCDMIGDKLSEFYTQAGLTECSWILFDSLTVELVRVVVRNGLHLTTRCAFEG